ncbi:MAG: hypothetical protein ACUVWR_07955 [Anaerolineae bacterium]
MYEAVVNLVEARLKKAGSLRRQRQERLDHESQETTRNDAKGVAAIGGCAGAGRPGVRR